VDPEQSPKRRRGVRYAVIAAGSAFLISASLSGVDPQKVGAAHSFAYFSALSLRQLACVEKQVHESVPRGTVAIVDPSEPYWRQRLTEMNYEWLQLVGDRSKAAVELAVSVSTETEGCKGAVLKVQRL